MIRKLPNTTRAKLPGIAGVAVLLVVWQLVCVSGLVPSYMLPSPVQVVTAFVTDAPALWENLLITLQEAALGLGIGIAVKRDFGSWRDILRNFVPNTRRQAANAGDTGRPATTSH